MALACYWRCGKNLENLNEANWKLFKPHFEVKYCHFEYDMMRKI